LISSEVIDELSVAGARLTSDGLDASHRFCPKVETFLQISGVLVRSGNLAAHLLDVFMLTNYDYG
jgi:hypothetical protein